MTRHGPTRVRRAVIFGCGGVILVTMTAMALIDVRSENTARLGLTTVASLAYVVALRASAHGAGGSRRDLAVCLGLALAWRLALLISAPVLSDDVYRYVWDGRVQRLGLNPYVTAPADPALAHLHTEVTRQIDPTNAALPTIYPPAAQLFFRGVTAIDESVTALLLASLLCDALIVVVLLRWLAVSGRSPWAVLAYAWHPLVAIEGAGGGHIDLVGVLFVVLAGWMLSRRRTARAAVAFVIAVGVKFLPIVLAPLFWRRIRVRDALLAGAVGVGLYMPFMSRATGLPLGSLGTYTEKWRFNGPLFGWLEPSLGIIGVLALATAAGFAVSAFARWRLAADAPAAWAWPMAASVLLMPAVYPWYLLWVTPFLIVPATVPLVVWTLASLLTYAVWGAQLGGAGWVLPGWVMPVEYGLVAAGALGLLLARRAGTEPVPMADASP